MRALRAARIAQLTDPLTGLANRRGMERYGGDLWRERGERGEPLLVLVVDIDHFKRINDTAGHAEGDRVIQAVSDVLSSSMRKGDVAVRMGGEEFLLLIDAPPSEARQIGERLRTRVEEEVRTVTVIVGVAEAAREPDQLLPDAIWRVVEVADTARYEATKTGRNRVVVAADRVAVGS